MGNYCCDQKNSINILFKKSTLTSQGEIRQGNAFYQNQPAIFKGLFHQNFSGVSYQLQVLGKLGQGGQATILLCQASQLRLSKSFKSSQKIPLLAIKRYEKSRFRTEDSIKSLLLEHSIMSQFECPFIIQAYSFSETKRQIYFFLPYAKGGDLNSFLGSFCEKTDLFRRTGIPGVKFIIQGVIIALQALHSNLIVYRDLKLQNILIDQQGYPVLTDFGISIKENQSSNGVKKGSIPYLAPQIICQNSSINRSIDFWSLGILIYYLCFQRFPFSEKEVLSSKFLEICRNREKTYSIGNLRKFKGDCCKSSLEDLLNKLLVVQSRSRLGVNNIQQLKKHKLFNDTNWRRYQRKEQDSPLKEIVSKFPGKVQYFSTPNIYIMNNIPKIRQIYSLKYLETTSTYIQNEQ